MKIDKKKMKALGPDEPSVGHPMEALLDCLSSDEFDLGSTACFMQHYYDPHHTVEECLEMTVKTAEERVKHRESGTPRKDDKPGREAYARAHMDKQAEEANKRVMANYEMVHGEAAAMTPAERKKIGVEDPPPPPEPIPSQAEEYAAQLRAECEAEEAKVLPLAKKQHEGYLKAKKHEEELRKKRQEAAKRATAERKKRTSKTTKKTKKPATTG